MKILAKLATIAFLFAYSCQPKAVNGWALYYSTNASTQSCSGDLTCFTFPGSGGSVNYLMEPWSTKVVPGMTVTATFRVVSTGPIYQGTPNGATTDTPPYRVTLFVDQQNDLGVNPTMRWWCTGVPSGHYVFGSAENTTVTLSCPLTTANGTWTDVDGNGTASQLQVMLGNIGSVGLTFGGNLGLGHGLFVASGSSQFQLINYSIQ
jgi:hypothetical protein